MRYSYNFTSSFLISSASGSNLSSVCVTFSRKAVGSSFFTRPPLQAFMLSFVTGFPQDSIWFWSLSIVHCVIKYTIRDLKLTMAMSYLISSNYSSGDPPRSVEDSLRKSFRKLSNCSSVTSAADTFNSDFQMTLRRSLSMQDLRVASIIKSGCWSTFPAAASCAARTSSPDWY